MKTIFERYADELFKFNKFNNIYKFPDGKNFGFIYRGYEEGLTAKKPLREKQGLFDIYVYTGGRYLNKDGNKAATHYKLIKDLVKHSSLGNCERVWIGRDNPQIIGRNIEEKQALLTLALLMFEQEINYGDENFQQYTNFSPRNNLRPRDMLFGFVKMAFERGVEYYPYWFVVNGVKMYPHFNGSFYRLEEIYKEYFFNNSHDIEIRALMKGEYLKKFKDIAEKCEINRNFNFVHSS